MYVANVGTEQIYARVTAVAGTSLTLKATDIVGTGTISVGTVTMSGLKGLDGTSGIVKVTHGSDPNVARPTATIVYWVGTVQPVNALPDDLLMLK